MTRDTRKQRAAPSTTTQAVRILGALLLALAVVTELRRPREERTWNGRLLGFVPYDLRPPTWERFRRALWSPDDPRLVLPRAWGIGWSPNLGRLVRLVRRGG